MNGLFAIYSVANFESKTLFRSWFFRIMTGLSILILFFIDLLLYAEPNSAAWDNRAIESTLPYTNLFLLNFVQSVIAVFLASDFMSRDKKLDTTEVIFVRPVSNTQYIIGKTLGILYVFLIINLLALTLSFGYNIILSDVPIAWGAYLLYPLLISLPSLLFILGLSFVIMLLVKNQAITFVLVLGYIGVSIFYLKDKFYFLSDFMGINVSMIRSGIVGFSNLDTMLYHRALYFFVGLSFIVLTIRLLGRLPQSKVKANLAVVVAALLMSLGVYAGIKYYNSYEDHNRFRNTAIYLNNRFFHFETPIITSHQISITQRFFDIAYNSTLVAKPEGERFTDTLVLSLNSGLEIKQMTIDGEKSDFVRRSHLILLPLNSVNRLKDSLQIAMNVEGGIDERTCYLDINWDLILARKAINGLPLHKRHAFIESNYLLLTPENIWYPIGGVTYNHKNLLRVRPSFTRFGLTVLPRAGLVPISQGSVIQENNTFVFAPKMPLSGLTLAIGNYKKMSTTINNVEISINYLDNHDFFSQYFQISKDTLPTVLTSLLKDYERGIDLKYQFEKIALVEVPVQFHAFNRKLTETFENVQPEMILISEKGAGLRGADFARSKAREDRENRNEKGANKKLPVDVEIGLFRRFAYSTFFSGVVRSSNMIQGGGDSRGFSLNFGVSSESTKNPYILFPLYYNYINSFYAPEIPYFNTIIENYLKEGMSTSFFSAMQGGITSAERANLALQSSTMEDIMNDPKQRYLISDIVKQKGNYLISLIQQNIGIQEFDNFIYYLLEDNRYKNLTVEAFTDALKEETKFDLQPYLDKWKRTNEVANFIFSETQFFETRDDYGPVFLIRFKATNTSNVAGVLYCTMRTSGGGPSQGSSTNESRIYQFEPNQSRDIQIMLYTQPRMLTLNTMLSSNIPSNISVFLRKAEKFRGTAEEYNRVAEIPVRTTNSNEFVVDNEHANFELKNENQQSKIRDLIAPSKDEPASKYKSVSDYNGAPDYWQAVCHSAFYGSSIRSGYYARNGSGKLTATWKTLLPDSGLYDVYVYIPTMIMAEMRGGPRGGGGERREGGQGGGAQGGSSGRGLGGPQVRERDAVYNYMVSAADGMRETKFYMNRVQDGWNKLGTFYFKADTATVSLKNNAENTPRIFADAVKWVKINENW